MKLLKKNYFLTIFFGLCVLFIVTNIVISTSTQVEDTHITIESGDSLWVLADKFGTDRSKEAWIDEVMKLNSLPTAHIKAGDVLVLPETKHNWKFDNSTELAGDE